MKAIITETCSDHKECNTMEHFEKQFGAERLAGIMKGLDAFFLGWIVSDDTPLGYVSETGSLIFDEYPHMVKDI